MTLPPLVAGDGRRIAITVQDPDGIAIDLTGSTIDWTLADAWTGKTALRKSLGSGIAAVDLVGGRVEITLAPSETTALAGDLRMWLTVAPAAGGRSTVLDVPWSVLPGPPQA